MNHKRISRTRRRLAGKLDRAAIPEHPFRGRGPRYLVDARVTAACAPSLRVIAARLRDDTAVLDEDDLGEVRRFVTSGDSLFFGQDIMAAHVEANRLEHVILGIDAVPGEPQLEIAV